MNLYWNEGTDSVEYVKSNDNCPIINSKHDDDIVIESWYTDNTHSQVINFSYVRGYERDRNRFFRDNNVLPYETELRWIMIPKSEYEQLIKQYASEDKMEVEE
jgi:hypothetical protein